MRIIDKIITNANCKYGAPLGRSNVGKNPTIEPNMDKYKHVSDTYLWNTLYVSGKRDLNVKTPKIFDCFVPMNGAYDKGGVYWGLGISPYNRMRVSYTKDLKYINFYRT